MEKAAVDERPAYDPKCYLCPGNDRIGGEPNPKYESTYVFGNDFPAVKSEQPEYAGSADGDALENTLLVCVGYAWALRVLTRCVCVFASTTAVSSP